MTFGSLFAGIEGFGLGFIRAGLVHRWSVEIDADCRRVIAARFTGMICSDVRECGKHNLEPVDVIAGGFPCQDLSVAGKRAGLAGKRSGLFYELTRIADELRPRFLVWENVPGLLTSDRGRDFARVLMELGRIGFHGCWTVLDAQFFGLAQRRRRVFGVFARSDIGAERCAEILALWPRSRWDSQESKQARSGVASTLRGRSASAGVNSPGRGGEDDDNLVAFNWQAAGKQTSLGCNHDSTGSLNGSQTPALYQANGAASFRGGSPSLASSDDNGSNQVVVGTLNYGNDKGGFRTEPGEHIVTHTLSSEGHDAGEDGTGRGTPLVAGWMSPRVLRNSETSNEVGIKDGKLADTLQSDGPGAVAFNIVGLAQEGKNHAYETDVSGCLQHKGLKPSGNEAGTVIAMQERGREGGRNLEMQEDKAYSLNAPAGGGRRQENTINAGMTVRRLTPTECARLQGFPDDWLDIEPPLSDSAKYRMLGNAVAVPCAEWLGRRLLAAL